MNATTIVVAIVGCAAGLATAAVTFFGKRTENAITGYSSLTDNLQEERATLKAEVAELKGQLVEKDTRIAELNAQLAEKSELRAADQAEIVRLRNLVVQLGGTL